MFDWNDEELTNIIWGEAGESDDHIVPYPDLIEEKPPILFGDPTKKETNQHTLNISPVELKKPTIKSEHGVELDRSSKYDDSSDPANGFDFDSWPEGPDLSFSNATKSDQGSIGTDTSKNVTKSPKSGFSRDEKLQFDKDSGIFENPPVDGEQGDFVDDGWANIGSFDDLDRIFSNSDPIFGDMSVGSADKLWSSSKDVISSSVVPAPLAGDSSDSPLGILRTSIDQSEIKAQCTLVPSQSFASGYENLNETTHRTPQDVQTCAVGKKIQASRKQLCDGTAATHNELPDKLFPCLQVRREKRLGKSQKLDKNFSDTRTAGSPLQQVNRQRSPPMVNPCAPLVLTQPVPHQRPETFQQKHFSGAPLASPLYGNMVNHYPTTSVLAQFHPGERCRELLPSGYEVPPANANPLTNLDEAPLKPPAMTPKEKIEKLRRQQQMRAILAIQKQQQQFGNQVSVSEPSSMEGGKIEVDDSLSNFPSLEPNSPVEQDDSNSISMVFDNCSVEESVLYWLQDTIAKLDTRIRLCIRDSLFRLAQSAMHRQYPNDTSSANTNSRDEVLGSKGTVSHNRSSRIPEVETGTNPIDRTVAHLLFHRPLEFPGKSAETPESPLSANIPYERKANLFKNLAKGHFPESLENARITSPRGSKCPGIFSEGDQSQSGPSFIASENASKTENTDRVHMKSETSK